MKVKYTVLTILVAVLVLLIGVKSSAISARSISEIEKVRSKALLDADDSQAIDRFVAEAVRELVNTRDFSSAAKIRTAISSRKNSGKQPEQTQYTAQFSESAGKHIPLALEEANDLKPQSRRFKAVLNLLILVNDLEDLRLTNLAMGRLNDENKAIQYWAVHCLANDGIIRQLNSSKAANSKLAKTIVSRLKGLVEHADHEIIAQIAGFAAKLELPEAEQLLLQVADMRIKKYADWTVDNELLDSTILGLLFQKASSSGSGKSAFGRRFGQLYSYVFHRYINGGDSLTALQKHRLSSVLVEVEQSYISPLLGRQITIKRAVERTDYSALSQEHNKLLGDQTALGQLAEKLDFDYGRDNNNNKRIAPLPLSDRSK